MHALFDTSNPAFSYITPNSLITLRWLQGEWTKAGDGPLITMDAGPNIHLLFRSDQQALAENWFQRLPVKVPIIKSWSQGV